MIDYVQERDKCSFREACETLGLDFDSERPDRFSSLRKDNGKTESTHTVPPPEAWQDRARQFVEYAQTQLWEGPDSWGIEYLRGRGLTDAMILDAGLGYNPKDWRDAPERWGLIGKKIWLPAGVVIPWVIGGDLWRVNVRLREPFRNRKGKLTKYIGPRGWAGGNPLYNADALGMDKPAVLTEGEIDALTIEQVACDLVTPVATGSTHGSRRTRWLARLALPPRVLVAYDNEEDRGDEASKYWLGALSNAKRWRPYWEDANAMAQDGASVRRWIEAGLGGIVSRSSLAIPEPA